MLPTVLSSEVFAGQHFSCLLVHQRYFIRLSYVLLNISFQVSSEASFGFFHPMNTSISNFVVIAFYIYKFAVEFTSDCLLLGVLINIIVLVTKKRFQISFDLSFFSSQFLFGFRVRVKCPVNWRLTKYLHVWVGRFARNQTRLIPIQSLLHDYIGFDRLFFFL